MQILTGTTTDISALLNFHFYEEVYYATGQSMNDHDYTWLPSGIIESKGNWVGTSENVGDVLTYKILTSDTKKIIHRSMV